MPGGTSSIPKRILNHLGRLPKLRGASKALLTADCAARGTSWLIWLVGCTWTSFVPLIISCSAASYKATKNFLFLTNHIYYVLCTNLRQLFCAVRYCSSIHFTCCRYTISTYLSVYPFSCRCYSQPYVTSWVGWLQAGTNCLAQLANWVIEAKPHRISSIFI